MYSVETSIKPVYLSIFAFLTFVIAKNFPQKKICKFCTKKFCTTPQKKNNKNEYENKTVKYRSFHLFGCLFIIWFFAIILSSSLAISFNYKFYIFWSISLTFTEFTSFYSPMFYNLLKWFIGLYCLFVSDFYFCCW